MLPCELHTTANDTHLEIAGSDGYSSVRRRRQMGRRATARRPPPIARAAAPERIPATPSIPRRLVARSKSRRVATCFLLRRDTYDLLEP